MRTVPKTELVEIIFAETRARACVGTKLCAGSSITPLHVIVHPPLLGTRMFHVAV